MNFQQTCMETVEQNDGKHLLCPWNYQPDDTAPSIFRILHNSASWPDELGVLADYYQQHGQGIVSCYHAFTWDAGQNRLQGILYPDTPPLDSLLGYESQKAEICKNTEQFLHGLPANHVLLYGSSGTGKSTMVRGILNRYEADGLKMVEIRREDLTSLSRLIAELRQYHRKFIIFIDDLLL